MNNSVFSIRRDLCCHPVQFSTLLSLTRGHLNFAWMFPFFFFPWLCHTTCGSLVPQPRVEPRPWVVKTPSTNHWTTRKFPNVSIFFLKAVVFWSFVASSALAHSSIINWPFYEYAIGHKVSLQYREKLILIIHMHMKDSLCLSQFKLFPPIQNEVF